MKNVSRNKLLFCFRPDVEVETVLQSKGLVNCPAAASLATCFDLENEEIKASRTTPSSQDCRCSRNSGGGGSMTSRPPRRTLSRAVKAVVFGTILIKKVREREGYHQQKSYQWKRGSSLNSEGFHTKEDDESVNSGLVGIDQENKSNWLASLYPLSTGSSSSFPLSQSKSMNSLASLSTVAEKNKKTRRTTAAKRRNADRSRYAFNSGIGLLVISLVIAVMKGRLLAIFFTSIWVYFFAWIHIEDRCPKKKTKYPETEFTDTRKSACHNRSKKEKPEKTSNL